MTRRENDRNKLDIVYKKRISTEYHVSVKTDHTIRFFGAFDSNEHLLQNLLEQQQMISRQVFTDKKKQDGDPELRTIYAMPADDYLPPKQTVSELLYLCFERMVAFVVLVLGFPLMLLQYIIIRLDSPGSALFLQARTSASIPCLGSELEKVSYLKPLRSEEKFKPDKYYLYPQLFRFIKFRTMYSDAKERFPERYIYNYSESEFLDSAFKDLNDPRITRVGQWLRQLTLDELPNFWCVLVGDMRLVGPRPEHPQLLSSYPGELMKKFTIKPGITGLAQISGRGHLGIRDTIAFDLQYIENRTILLDLKILVKTLWLVLARKGAF